MRPSMGSRGWCGPCYAAVTRGGVEAVEADEEVDVSLMMS